MLEPAGNGTPRAFLRVGGTTVAQQQLGLAFALECGRVVCLAHGLRPELIALQHEAERAGAQFHVIAGARALLGLITAQDEVFVFGDGLFVSRSEAAELLGQGPAVLVQPIDQGLAGGFERIDINYAAAGAMRIPGRLVERIADLPADCDASSALQRIALQSGIRQREIPSLAEGRLFWSIVHDEDQAHAIEPRWIQQRIRGDVPLYPSRALALFTVRKFGPPLLHAGNGSLRLTLAATLMALIALGSGWLGHPVVGLVLCALGWIVSETAELLAQIEGSSPKSSPAMHKRRTFRGLLADALIIGLAVLGVYGAPWQSLLDRLFAPLILVALLRILPKASSDRWTAWLDDRALLALFMAAAVASGRGNEIIQGAALVAALTGVALRVPKRG
ncbi:MAG: hypothetical protein JSR96_09165 [Proteobacteria bacterium]|nr:hypothetical protein [Pseudomonadota bacterium]